MPTVFVLWIDDDIDESLLRLLGDEGFHLDVATTGTAGLHTAQARHYDAIVMDLHLPDVHGFSVLERLRQEGVSAPVMVVTGHYLAPETETHARAAGAAAFRYKPLWVDELATALRDLSSKRRDSKEALLARLLAALSDPALNLQDFIRCAGAVRVLLDGSDGASTQLAAAEALVSLRPGSDDRGAPPDPRVQRALERLIANPKRWSEAELAQQVGVSRAHFGRLVQRHAGLDYRNLTNRIAMKAAVIEVLMTREQFAQIAYRLDLHPAQLDRQFRNTFGCTPRELRSLSQRLRTT